MENFKQKFIDKAYTKFGVKANGSINFEQAFEIIDEIEQCNIAHVANRRELLLSYSEWWDKNYSPSRLDLHRQKDIDEFLSQ